MSNPTPTVATVVAATAGRRAAATAGLVSLDLLAYREGLKAGVRFPEEAFLYLDGHGQRVERIVGITDDLWVKTTANGSSSWLDQRSWCCHGGTPVYFRAISPAVKGAAEAAAAEYLAALRAPSKKTARRAR